MKRMLFIIVCILSVCRLGISQTKSSLCTPDTSSSTSLQELKQLDSQLDDAQIHGDKTVFERLLADEMVSVSDEGDVTGKNDVIKGVRPWPVSVKATLVAEDVQVHLFGETAVVSGLKTMKWERNNLPHSDQYRETNTYVRRDGRWQLIASQQAHAAPPYYAKDVQLNLNIDPALMHGNKAASVVLIEFSDYQCSFCRRFAAQTLNKIEQDYINTGRVGFVFRDYPMESIHPYAFKAATVAQCAAAQGRFWEMNQRLFQEPMALTENDLLAHAQGLNLDMAKFQQCAADEKTAATVRQGMVEGASLGVEGTPIFMIGVRKPNSSSVKVLRMIQGAYPYDVFKATLDTIVNAQAP